MLRRQLAQIQKAQRDIITKAKSVEDANFATNQQQMVIMTSSESKKRKWKNEIEALDDEEIIQFIIDEEPPNSAVQFALSKFAASLEESEE